MNLKAMARSQFNKVASILGGGAGDFEAARTILRDVTGKSDIDALSDREAEHFCNATLSKFGGWKMKAIASEVVTSNRSTDGSRKPKLDNAFAANVYRRWNSKKAGVVIKNPTSKMDDE